MRSLLRRPFRDFYFVSVLWWLISRLRWNCGTRWTSSVPKRASRAPHVVPLRSNTKIFISFPKVAVIRLCDSFRVKTCTYFRVLIEVSHLICFSVRQTRGLKTSVIQSSIFRCFCCCVLSWSCLGLCFFLLFCLLITPVV